MELLCEWLCLLLQRFLVPLALEHAVITPEDYSPVFSNLQVRQTETIAACMCEFRYIVCL